MGVVCRTDCSVFRQARTSFCARVASCASVFASARRPSRWHTCSGLGLGLGLGSGSGSRVGLGLGLGSGLGLGLRLGCGPYTYKYDEAYQVDGRELILT